MTVSRRDFLGVSGLAAAGAVAGTTLAAVPAQVEGIDYTARKTFDDWTACSSRAGRVSRTSRTTTSTPTGCRACSPCRQLADTGRRGEQLLGALLAYGTQRSSNPRSLRCVSRSRGRG